MKKKLQKFTVEIQEVWVRTIEVEAENEEEAQKTCEGSEVDFTYSHMLDSTVKPGHFNT